MLYYKPTIDCFIFSIGNYTLVKFKRVFMSFAVTNGLRPADVVIVPKSELQLIAHYLVYMGIDANGTHFYLENNQHVGVRWVTETELNLENSIVKRIRLFNGDDHQRNEAIKKAVSLIGQNYDLAKFNCENFANVVQTGYSYSKQVDFVNGVLVAGGIILLGRLFFGND
ncbi:lecithin retinol acyltransferase family protein [Mucilaginibacter paludis]|uniref:LRAT domain-containing protein n=1 Tax=Mucilaginibacter paludis DSM 18603 TaxID=714943 RepID=H1YDT0_9SPHI|nr:lecithin retinol acyltransferase family protein [Mucilaginibacter paludis]EHQ24270.1 hypothetical protein Mucpa_0067 [Mucilaginibacter paludis DSM 18603]